MSGPNGGAEEAIKSACDAQQYDVATARAFEAYGPEVLSFLIARLRSESDGEEAFSMFAEDLVKAMPSFGFRCSVRAYLYTLARNAANRYASAPHNRRNRNLAMTGNATLSVLMEQARTMTQAYRRTDVKDKLRELREQLPVEDQTILILHVDRSLPWREIAMVMNESGESLDEEELARESARVRKRFERAKAELRARAEKAGLIKKGEP